ncbi:endonuclease/exonuclease/phosphatase family protein [Photobacterium minamisatsumaniensis]|uniref:endonuclease/exonuclease/phosphatase family protein n=1 Tax=Photobacterium minamisatsumaniensis TaxID=2910233 RepID=UPI003D14F651
MSSPRSGEIRQQVASQSDTRFSKLAAIIQHQQPDVLMLCEFDHPGEGGDDGALADFCHHYLAVSQHDQHPVYYPYRYCPPTNTGLRSEYDLDGDGVITLPNDAQGFGEHHGHFGFVILSRYPIDETNIRSWQTLLWQDFPNHKMPPNYYSKPASQSLRLSSKNHLVIPIVIDGHTVNLVCCHPTPPVFDGDEKRNVRRNHDELMLVKAILDDAEHLVDDSGQIGGLPPEQHFVIVGDLNADRVDGDGMKPAIQQLLMHPRVNRSVASGRMTPKSLGGRFLRPWLPRKGRASEWTHISGLRLDYVIPSANLTVLQSSVFWPDKKDSLRYLITDDKGRERPQAGSDHRMVSVDVSF